MSKKKHISLFSGIGGFDLAAESVGWENVAHCEWNKFGNRILKYYWPNAKSYEDITKTDFNIFRGNTDILTGGFPCQGFSLAGKRLGTDDARYLWPEMLRVIKETKPAFVIGENVTGIISMEDKSGIDRDVFFEVEGRSIIRTREIDQYDAIYSRQAKMLIVSICQDLEKEGYEVQPILIPAASVQAPHRRDRVWFIAYSNSNDARGRRYAETRRPESETQTIKKERKRFRGQFERINDERNVANAASERRKERLESRRWKNETENKTRLEPWTERPSVNANASSSYGATRCLLSGYASCHRTKNKKITIDCNYDGNGTASDSVSFRFGRKSHRIRKTRFIDKKSTPNDWRNFPTQSPVCFGNDGLSSKLDGITFSKWRTESIKAAGNAIVPQVAIEIFKAVNIFLDNKK